MGGQKVERGSYENMISLDAHTETNGPKQTRMSNRLDALDSPSCYKVEPLQCHGFSRNCFEAKLQVIPTVGPRLIRSWSARQDVRMLHFLDAGFHCLWRAADGGVDSDSNTPNALPTPHSVQQLQVIKHA